MKTFEKRLSIEGRKVRLTNFVDEESIAFEEEAQFESATEQTLTYVRESRKEAYVLQIRGTDERPAFQACIYVGKPRFMPFFAMGSVPYLGKGRNQVEERFAIRVLKTLSREIPGVMTLRLQPLRLDRQELTDFQLNAEAQGFYSVDPLGPVRTLILDLGSTAEEFHAKLPQKTRAKFRHAGRNKVELKVVTDEKFIAPCRNAVNESMRRHGGEDSGFDFEAAFALARKRPDLARIVGLFLKDQPDNLLAYTMAFRSGKRCELTSAGAFGNPELRSMPFNYFLLGEILNWAREQGCTEMDMGGITPGGPDDPLQGISRFKRSFTENELEVGRELLFPVRPVNYFVYRSLKALASKNKEAPAPTKTSHSGGMLPIYD